MSTTGDNLLPDNPFAESSREDFEETLETMPLLDARIGDAGAARLATQQVTITEKADNTIWPDQLASRASEIPPRYSLSTAADRPAISVCPTANESDWHSTLCSLQTKLKELHQAKRRARFRTRFAVSLIKRVRSTLSTPRIGTMDNANGDVEAQGTVALDVVEQESSAQSIRVLEELVLADMRKLVHVHPDPIMQVDWATRADRFAEAITRADASSGGMRCELATLELVRNRESVISGVAKGFGIIIVTPLILAIAALFGAGAILYGVGKLITGLGHLLTFGRFK